MIDVKKAVEIAKSKASEMLGNEYARLEEIERDQYKGRDVWAVTLSLPVEKEGALAAFTSPQLQYKRFFIDAESGDLVAMKLRDMA